MALSTVDPHYSQVCTCDCPLTKICKSPINIWDAFVVTCGHLQRSEKFESLDAQVPG